MFTLHKLTLLPCMLVLAGLAACSKLEPQVTLGQTVELLPLANREQLASCMAPEVGKIQLGLGKFIDKLKAHSDGELLLGRVGLLAESSMIDGSIQLRSEIKTIFDTLGSNISIIEITEPSGSNLFQQLTLQAKAIVDRVDYSEQELQFFKTLTQAYLRAYFIKPLTTGPSEAREDTGLRQSIAAIFKRHPDDKKMDEVMALLASRQPPARSAGGFIDRDGSRFGFPGVATADETLPIDHSQIGADLMRIFLNAMRDTLAPLPVLAGSTAGELDQSFDELNFSGSEKPISLLWHLDRQDPSKMAAVSVTARQFEDMQARARQAEASTAGMVGKAIRGGAFGSLNNEALARQLETAAGVLARQTTERAQWCLLAQGRH